MTEDELIKEAYEAVKELEYRATYRADPDADEWAQIILELLGWRDNAVNLYPDLDRTT